MIKQCAFCTSTVTFLSHFTITLSDILQITKGVCNSKDCQDKLVRMSEEVGSTFGFQGKMLVLSKYFSYH